MGYCRSSDQDLQDFYCFPGEFQALFGLKLIQGAALIYISGYT
jgi:hypothetical protein